MSAIASRRLFAVALLLALVVVVAGAFVRLKDAGLGCPDWPGCYGQLLGIADAEMAAASHPDSDYDRVKALIEVGHRYLAAALGLTLVFAAAADWRRRRRFLAPQWLLALVVAQGLLGMLTVTEKLHPIIVVSHLLGGMLIVALLAAICFRAAPAATDWRQRRWHLAASAMMALQIALGGWVSANYAGLACPDFPLCHGGWMPPVMDFSGYSAWRELGKDAAGAPIGAAALTTIHWAHRVGALLTTAVVGLFAALLWRHGRRRDGATLATLLTTQLALGVLSVAWHLPLTLAISHNAVAALLVVKLAALRVQWGAQGAQGYAPNPPVARASS